MWIWEVEEVVEILRLQNMYYVQSLRLAHLFSYLANSSRHVTVNNPVDSKFECNALNISHK